MTRFSDWSIGNKISVGFGIVAALVIGTTMYQVHSIGNVEDASRNLNNTTVARLVAAQKLSLASKDLRNRANRYIVDGYTPNGKTMLMSRIDSFNSSLKDYESLSPSRSKMLSQSAEPMVSQAQTILNLTPANTNAEQLRTTYNDKLEPQFDSEISALITKEDDMYTKEGQAFDKNIDELFFLVVWVAISKAIAAMAVGFIVVFWLTKSITRISDGARRIMHGDFSRPIPVMSKDELGQISDAFNTVAQRLQNSKHSAHTEEKET